ncbi:hypothetical protein ILUMI_21562 [Ignelater luminosus]|uniref:Uncharacterized protein n=1 Tax=Ignelater luminosus TaxID=2038154 RepID=A0A8K0CG18_IGNLU|nr:hypothetical protein ILUMI_21562 [Ignelater luminosus]
MNALVILAIAIAAVNAKPLGEQIVAVTQDTLGNYDLKYAINGISRAEHRDADGLVSGGFSYIDPHGVLRKTIYTAGKHGFHAIGTDIPLPVGDTPEVAIAKSAHIELLRAAQPVETVPVPAIPVAAPAAVVPAVRSISVAAPAAVLEVPRAIALPAAPAVASVALPAAPVVRSIALPAAPAVASVAVPVAPAVRSIALPAAPVAIAVAPDSPDTLDAEGRADKEKSSAKEDVVPDGKDEAEPDTDRSTTEMKKLKQQEKEEEINRK